MPVDIESRLRQALHARAAEVEPDPATWERVRARVRRARGWRWSAAGALAGAAVVVAAVLLGAPGEPRVAFDEHVGDQPTAAEPRPPAAGADAEPDSAGAGTADPGAGRSVDAVPVGSCTQPVTVLAALSRAGDLWLACTGGGERPLTAGADDDRNPAVAPDGEAVVFERRAPGADDPVLVHVETRPGGEPQVLGGGSLPVFATDGRLAWVQHPPGQEPLVLVGQPFGEPEQEIAVRAPRPPARVTGLAWDAAGDRLLYTTVDADGAAQAWTAPPGGGQPEPLTPVAGEVLALAAAPDGTLGVLSRPDPGGDAVDLVTLDPGAAGAPPGGDARVAAELGRLLDAGADVRLSSAGYVRSGDEGSGPWRVAPAPSWFVADGEALWLVEAGGAAHRVARGVSAAGANPAVVLEEPDVTAPSPPAALPGQRLPEAVEATRRRLAEAAAAGDVDALRGLMAASFTYSFGGSDDPDEAAAYLRQHPEVVEEAALLLSGPHGVSGEGADRAYVWPRAHALPASQWTDDDVAFLREALGASDEDLAAWRAGQGYTGLRLGIGADGAWRFLVAGD